MRSAHKFIPSILVAFICTPALAEPAQALPFTVQGYFGKGESLEISVQNKYSEKSAWIKPGDTFAEWHLDTINTNGIATFSKNGVVTQLRISGENSNESMVTAESIRLDKTQTMQLFIELSQSAEAKSAKNACSERARKHLAQMRPDLCDTKGNLIYTTLEARIAWRDALIEQYSKCDTNEFKKFKNVCIAFITQNTERYIRDPEFSLDKIPTEQRGKLLAESYEECDRILATISRKTA